MNGLPSPADLPRLPADVTLAGPCLDQSAVCTPILRALPDWFGLEASILQYASEIDRLPTWLARDGGQVTGFLSLKLNLPYAAEIYVMGLLPAAHRRGIGRALVHLAQEWLKGRGVEYLQVKTLGPSHPDPAYARTRAFYAALAFRPLEEFPQIWDEHNPCLILIKKL